MRHEADLPRIRAETDQIRAKARDRLDTMLDGLRRVAPIMDPDLMHGGLVSSLYWTGDFDFLVAMLSEALMRLTNEPIHKGDR